jgi:hypothetical protein
LGLKWRNDVLKKLERRPDPSEKTWEDRNDRSLRHAEIMDILDCANPRLGIWSTNRLLMMKELCFGIGVTFEARSNYVVLGSWISTDFKSVCPHDPYSGFTTQKRENGIGLLSDMD